MIQKKPCTKFHKGVYYKIFWCEVTHKYLGVSSPQMERTPWVPLQDQALVADNWFKRILEWSLVFREKLKFKINYFWTCVFHYINIFCKKLEYEIKPNFSKNRFKKCKKITTTTGSSVNFLSYEPNGLVSQISVL